MVGDPDDHRPGSEWALVVDPGDTEGRVDDLAVIVERIGPGEQMPLHVQRVNEVILAHGPGRFRLGDEERAVDAGAVVFVPAGMAHGFQNDAPAPLPLQAVFPTTRTASGDTSPTDAATVRNASVTARGEDAGHG